MKRTRPLIALLLAVTMLLPCFLTGCSRNDYDVVMEYNGIKLTEDMYYYWMSTFKRNILSSYSDAFDTDAFWQQPYDEERTVEEYFTEVIRSRIMNYLIAQDLFKKNRLTLDSDIKKAIKDDINEKIEYYGSRGALNAELSNLMLNVDSLKTVYTWEEKHDAVYQWLYGPGGVDEVSDAKLSAYYKETYSCIRYIVLYTTKIKTNDKGEYIYDESGNVVTEEMTEEEIREKKEKAEACLGKMKAGEDFESLRKTYSEYDTSAYPNGFFVSANELATWGVDIILATQNAAVGDVYRVEEEAAIFLIEKLPLPSLDSLSESDLKQLSSLATNATAELYDAFYGELQKNVTVNTEIIDKYQLSKIAANPYFSI